VVLDFLGLGEELNKDRHLGPNHFRHDRREDVVDGAQGVTPRHLRICLVECGDEDDRGVLRQRTLTNHAGRLEAVHVGHPDVEQDDRKIPTQNIP